MNVPQMQQNLEHAQMQETILKAQLEVSTLFQCVGLFVKFFRAFVQYIFNYIGRRNVFSLILFYLL